MKFTKEEISLCKQVAEKHRKLIEHGDWYFNERMGMTNFWFHFAPYQGKIFIPLWTISDCLEFLRDKGWNDIAIEIRPYYDDIKCFAERGEVDKGCERGVTGEGKTALEACLKAVLAVLEEE